MQKWINDLSDLLKSIERDRPKVREFRRSFEAGKKQQRLYPVLENIYNECKEDPISLNNKGYILTLGLKSVTLRDVPLDRILQLFSNWDPTLYRAPELANGGPISINMMKQLLKHMDDPRMQSALDQIPIEQLENADNTFSDPKARELADKIVQRIKGRKV